MELLILTSKNNFIITFDAHKNCAHKKKLLSLNNYTFIFCKTEKAPIAIYCSQDIKTKDDVLNLINELAKHYILFSGIYKPDSYLDNLAKAFTDITDIKFAQ